MDDQKPKRDDGVDTAVPDVLAPDSVAPKHRNPWASWPMLLIIVGVVALLVNFGILPSASVFALLRLWPLAFIVFGLQVILGHSQRRLANQITIGALILAVVVALIGPAFGFGKIQATTRHFVEPLAPATSAAIEVAPSVGKVTISAGDSDKLIDADVTYVGQVNLAVSGTADKAVSLKQDNSVNSTFGVFDFLGNMDNLHWDVRLNPTIPLALTIDSGEGESTFDLSQLKLKSFVLSSGVGNINLTLPASDAVYESRVDSGVGNVQVTVSANAAVHLTLKGGVGNITVNVPSEAAVYVKVNSGLGNINLDSGRFTKLDGGDKDGNYETKDFASAARQITIDYDGGVGNLTLR